MDTEIRWLRQEGYEFTTISELLTMGKPFASPECYELKPGDNARYDNLAGKGTE